MGRTRSSMEQISALANSSSVMGVSMVSSSVSWDARMVLSWLHVDDWWHGLVMGVVNFTVRWDGDGVVHIMVWTVDLLVLLDNVVTDWHVVMLLVRLLSRAGTP